MRHLLVRPVTERVLHVLAPLPLAGLLLTSFLAGCPQPDGVDGPEPEPSAEPDAGPDADAGTEADGGDDDGGAPTDGGMPGVLRTVAARPLLGGMPLNNRFLDPRMTQQGFAWYFFSDDPFAYPQVVQVFHPGTPLGAAATQIDKSANPDGVQGLGAAKSSPGAHSVSVWAARRQGDPDSNLATFRASLLGVYEDGEGAVDLVLDPGSAPVIADGHVWRRFAAVIPQGPVGWAYLHFTDGSSADLLVAAPVMVNVSSAGFAAAPELTLFSVRSLEPHEVRGLALARAHMRDQLAPPPAPGPRRQEPGRPWGLRF